MADELSNEEKDYLAKLLVRRHDELLHELHHALSRDYKEGLKQEIDLTERAKQKLVTA